MSFRTPRIHEADVVLHPGGVEYITWEASGLPELPAIGEVSVSLDEGATWHTASLDGSSIKLLVAHPEAPVTDGAAVGVPGLSRMLVKLSDNPEVVIRDGGQLFCDS